MALFVTLAWVGCGGSNAPDVDASTGAACASGECGGKLGDASMHDARVSGLDGSFPHTTVSADGAVVIFDPPGGPSGDPNKDAPSPTDALPCDVAAVLAPCAECHAASPLFGAPMPLITWSDLVAPAKSDASQPVYQRVLTRVTDDASPMPPAPRDRLSAAAIATLQSWISAGTPKRQASCDAPAGTVDAGIPAPSYLPKPDDCENVYEVRAHGGTGVDDTTKFQMSGAPALQSNEYHCFYFAPPYQTGQSVFWYEPILDNIAHVHHWIMYTTENATHASGTHAACNANQPGATYVAIWAPGANNTAIPTDVGLQLPTGPNAGIILELHYFNDSGAPQDDASGIRFCTGAANKRPHTAVTHQTGTEGICLPPGNSSVSGHCAPRLDLGASHIRGIWPHLHKLGRRMTVTINRWGGTQEVIHDAPFDFNSQVFYPKDIVLNPGDTLDTACYYANDTSSPVHFGERTQDEMCYGFIMAWPPDSLANPPPLFGLSTGPAHRCVDPNSILRSCNGIADAPSTPATP